MLFKVVWNIKTSVTADAYWPWPCRDHAGKADNPSNFTGYETEYQKEAFYLEKIHRNHISYA